MEKKSNKQFMEGEVSHSVRNRKINAWEKSDGMENLSSIADCELVMTPFFSVAVNSPSEE